LLFLMMSINPLFLIPLHLGLLPIFAKDVFEGGGNVLGITLASIGAGGLAGGLVTASLNRVDRRGLAQLIAVLIYSMSPALFSVVAGLTGELWLATPFLFLVGAAESMYLVTNQTVVQLLAPDHLRGRLTSVLQITFIINPLGSLVAGSMADVFNAPIVGTVLSLSAFALALGILAFSSRMRNMRLSELRAASAVA
jgi:MFS family permease